MDELFGLADATSDEYVALRDKEKFSKQRAHAESLWATFQPLADSSFLNQIASTFQPRFWEMYLGATLVDLSFPTSSKDKGPDFLIDATYPPTWIEAVAPTAGQGPDAVPQQDYSGTASIVPEDSVILRIRAAIEEKHRKYEAYVQSRLMSAADPYVIAINGRDIPFSLLDDQPSYVVRSVYPFGMHIVTLDRQTAEIVDQGFQHRPYITKTRGSQVTTKVFEDPKYANISAVLYSRSDAWSMPGPLGDDFQLLHNPIAKNPLQLGWLKRGVELWATKDALEKKDWNANHNAR